MSTCFAVSRDGSRVAYEVCGHGPAVLLLHGGGGSRREWFAAGYAARLEHEFTVIAIDLRGHGESSLPTATFYYTIEKQLEDILAVADACRAEHFSLWGMSYGGKVGRYLAARSGRVDACVLMGTPLGPGVTGRLRQQAVDFCAHWPPLLAAQRDGSLDAGSLSCGDQELLRSQNLPVMLGWVRAMLDWPAIAPGDFRCPTLWLVGGQDADALASVREYESELGGTQLRLEILAGLDHDQLFDQIDRVFPILQAFTRQALGGGA